MIPWQHAVMVLLGTAPAMSIHQRLTGWLAVPDLAIIVLCAGVLLIFVECNLPGAILPGAVGLLLLLSGVYGLSLLPLRPAALIGLLGAAALLALSFRTPLLGLPAVAGTGSLIYSIWALIDQTRTSSRVHASVAVCAGILLGGSASLLGRIAGQARQNKAVS